MPDGAAQLRAALAVLRDNYRVKLRAQVAELRELAGALAVEPLERARVERFAQLAHSVTGSGATFGFPAVSDTARPLETLARGALDRGTPPCPEEARAAARLVEILELLALGEEQVPIAIPPGSTPPPAPQERETVILVEDDEALAQDLARQIGYFGYDVRTLAHPEELPALLDRVSPAAVLLDIVFPDGPLRGTEVELGKAVPKIFISARSDIEARLRAVRAGGAAYFSKPIDVNALIDTLEVLTARRVPEAYQVLLVDDDAVLTESYALALRDAGMRVTVINDPLKSLDPLAELQPDVILVDMYMPGCTGAELAAVLRQDPALVSVPIVFLSTEADPARKLQALRHGGDEFLVKPVPLDRLPDEVAVRAKRARALRAHMVKDGLTGLYNHATVKQLLAVEVARARRDDRPLAVALLDVDNFKVINDDRGHSAGDRVLKNLSWLLQKRLRKTDLVGRYGGEEFLVVLPGTGAEAAACVLDELRESFAGVRHQFGATGFLATFSVGVAGLSPTFSPDQLIDVADGALYAAKRAGRNRVELARGA